MNPVKAIPAKRSVIVRLAERRLLDARQTQEALVASGIIPDADLWKKFIAVSSLSLGAAFFLSGVIFFFAFNWHLLHKFMKLGSIAAVLLLAVAAGFLKGGGSLAGRLAWVAATVMIGVYLAVFGQVYQTGADAWQLFALWAVLAAGWTAVSFYPPQWTIFLVIAETAAVLAMVQLGGQEGDFVRAGVLLAAANAALYVIFELFRQRGAAWLNTPWFIRLVATAAVGSFLLPVSLYIFDFRDTARFDLFPGFTLVLFAFFGAALFFIVKKSRDLYVLAVAVFSLIVYGTDIYVHSIKKFNFTSAGPWIMLGLLIVGQAVGAVFIIRKTAENWTHKEAAHEDD
jgi:uncharacterized membrane protein